VFRTRDGGVISYEPGGQIEYSAPPAASLSVLMLRIESTVATLTARAARAGIELLTTGIDPYNSIETVPLQLNGERYTSMDRYFAAIGSAGACMMRQTAACQITIDAGSHPVARWRLLNALAPYVTALFANSPRYAGSLTGCASTRAHVWRHVDPARTGVPGAAADDPATAYEAFALAAPGILRRARDGEYKAFETLLADGDATEDDWGPHLTTLFPEIRPRPLGGIPTFEVRSADAVPLDWCAALAVFIAGLAYDRETAAEASALVGPPHLTLLARAAQVGLGDPAIRQTATELFAMALDGARRLGEQVIGVREREQAEAFGRPQALASRAGCTEVAIAFGGGARRSATTRHGETKATAAR
jgi:glutamate--cysteine ligase